jgi:3-hydroxymyristoyl/3-hydroxydecanoyl-(acyl carrier protein) dehydratase
VLQISQTYCILENHPSLAGHFPNAPIVPGVVLLDYAKMLLQTWQPALRIKGISQAKFLQPLIPQHPFTMVLTYISEDTFKFECICNVHTVMSGIFKVEKKL